jgi:hypothetical protein
MLQKVTSVRNAENLTSVIMMPDLIRQTEVHGYDLLLLCDKLPVGSLLAMPVTGTKCPWHIALRMNALLA